MELKQLRQQIENRRTWESITLDAQRRNNAYKTRVQKMQRRMVFLNVATTMSVIAIAAFAVAFIATTCR